MRRGVLLALLLLAPLVGATAATPPADDAAARWWTRTLLDVDRDGIDDALAPLLDGRDPLTVLVAYDHHPTPADERALARMGAQVTFAPRHFPLLVARVPPALVQEVARLPGVVLVERNDELRPLLAQSVPLVGAPQAWERFGATGRGVVVAVLDDGAFEGHPDFEGKIVASHNAATPQTPLGVAPASETVLPAGEDGHGTHVTGIVVGNGRESGGTYRGVAPDAVFVNVRVFTAPNRTSSDVVLRGLDWVLDHARALDIRVTQTSLGGRISDGTDALSRAVNIAVDQGMIVVAAAGNSGPSDRTIASPGAAEKSITVGAVDKRKSLAPFSSRGPTLDGRIKPDLVAPGSGIVSTVPPASTSGASAFASATSAGVYYGTLSGTSMAAPHVSGIVALMLEANPALSPREVKRILLATAQDVGAPGADNETGYGFVNGVAATQVAAQPQLLERAEFRDVLATIPDPPREPLFERLVHEWGRASRDGILPMLGALALLGVLIIGAAVVLAGRRRRRESRPPPPGPLP